MSSVTTGILKKMGFRTQAQNDIKAAKKEKERQARETEKYTSGNPETRLLTKGGRRRTKGIRRRGTRRGTRKRGRKGTRKRGRKH
jgi:hypothetical protein